MRGITLSVVFHTLAVLAVAMGLPHFHKPPAPASKTVTIDVVRLADITQASKGEKPKPKTDKKPDSDRDTTKKPVAKDQASKQAEVKPKPERSVPEKQSEPKSKPKVQVAEKPKAPAVKPSPSKPETRSKTAAPKRMEIDPRALRRQEEKPPEKKPKQKKSKKKPVQKAERPRPKDETKKPNAQPAPKIAARPRRRPRFKRKPEAKPKPEKRQVEVAEKPKGKPKNALDRVFKSVRRMEEKAREESDRDRTAARKPWGEKSATRRAPMTLSEIDAVRQQIKQQIKPCWNFPTGARNAEQLRVLIKVWLNRDGSVRRAQVMDRARMSSDPYFRAAAEAGRRAVENPRCSPLKLPAEKYDRWKVLIIDFDPSKLRTG